MANMVGNERKVFIMTIRIMENSYGPDLFHGIYVWVNIFVRSMNMLFDKHDIACKDIDGGILVTCDPEYESYIIRGIEDVKQVYAGEEPEREP